MNGGALGGIDWNLICILIARLAAELIKDSTIPSSHHSTVQPPDQLQEALVAIAVAFPHALRTL